MASKYAPLFEHLRTLLAGAWRASFADVERVLGADLPASARKHSAWWANGGHSQARAWLDAGFETCELDLSRRTVLFRRIGAAVSNQGTRAANDSVAHAPGVAERAAARHPSPHGATALALRGHDFEWTAEIAPDAGPSGQPIEYMPQARYAKRNEKPLNRHGRGPFCRFSVPGLPTAPGLYAVTVDRQLVYVGIASKDLRQRWSPSGYADIQPVNCFKGGQSTNCKINHAILIAARDGRVVELWIRRESRPRPLEARLIRELAPTWNDQR